MKPIVIAHRGASGYLPEHTIPAKVLAHAMGADYLEQDVIASRDDELVVLHDIHLDRVTDVAARFPGRARDDGRFYARDFDLDELRRLRVHERQDQHGKPVYPRRFSSADEPFHIHTLAEEIRVIRELNANTGHEAGIYPEIKRPAWHREEGVDIAPAMLAILAEHGYRDRSDSVFVQCFDADELVRIREELGCKLKLIQLIGENGWDESPTDFAELKSLDGLARVARIADGIGPWLQQIYYVNDEYGGPEASGLVAAAHDAGLLVHPYTFRSDDLPPGFGTLAELVEFCTAGLSIDGLFTDFPDHVIQLLEKQ